MSKAKAPLRKIVLCGESGVGKTNLLARLTKNPQGFLGDVNSTIGCEFASRVVGGVKLQIWDTAGQERYRAITNSYYRDAVCCILVYSVTSGKSFRRLERWLQEIVENTTEQTQILLLGNKCDLKKRKTTPLEIEHFIKQSPLHCIGNLLVSAKTNHNVEEAVKCLVKAYGIANNGGDGNDGENGDAKQQAKTKTGTVKLDGNNNQDSKKKDGCC